MKNTNESPIKNIKPKTKYFYGWIILFSCFFLGFLVGGIRFSIPLLIPEWISEFGWTASAASIAFSITSGVQCGFGIFSGWLIDSKGPKLMGIIGCILISIGLIGTCFLTSLALFYFYFAILGFGLSAIYLIPGAIVNKWFIQKRGLVTGITMSGGGVGTLIIPIIVALFISHYDWRSAQIFLGILSLFFIIFAFLLKHYPEDIGQKPYGQSDSKELFKNRKYEKSYSINQALKTSTFWLFVLIFMLGGFGYYVPWTQIPKYTVELGLSKMIGAYLLSMLGGCTIVGRIAGGRLGDKIGRKMILGICFAISGLATLFLVFSHSIGAFYLFTIFSGLSNGGFIVQMGPLMADFFGRKNLSLILGIQMSFTGLGWFVGSWLGGFIFDLTNSYHIAFLIAAFAYLITIILLIFIKKPSENPV